MENVLNETGEGRKHKGASQRGGTAGQEEGEREQITRFEISRHQRQKVTW